MQTQNKNLSLYYTTLWQTFTLFVIFSSIFAFYVYTEKEIDHANEARYQSHLLIDELRKSSNDLSRMARNYVVTGNPIYKENFNKIIDIREGNTPIPINYDDLNWDVVGVENLYSVHYSDQRISLLELIRHSGFSEAEFFKLSEAKKISDQLVQIENEAMTLLKADPKKAKELLQNQAFVEKKATGMSLISDAHILMDKRTLGAVHFRENMAVAIRTVFILFGGLLLFTLWRSYRALHLTLGGSLNEVHALISYIGRGNFSPSDTITDKRDDSILSWLSETKIKLSEMDMNRKNAEKELAASHELLTTIINTSPIRIFWKNTDLIYLGCNVFFANDAGEKSPQDIIGKNDYQLSWKNEANSYRDDDQLVIETGIPKLFFEEKTTVWDGKVHWLRTSKVPLRDANHKIIGVLGIYEDITEQKIAQDEKLRFSQAIEQSSSATLITNAEGTIEYINAAFVQMTGYSKEELIGKNPRLLQSNKTSPAVYDAMWSRITHGDSWQGEFIDQRKDGTEYIHSVNISPVFNSDGLITHYIATQEDITEKKRSEEHIHYLAHFDPLTGLPNRVKLDDHFQYILTLSKRNNKKFAVMFLDLDHFKEVNDSLGHNIGDDLLVHISKRFKQILREEDTVSRLGGDEFIFLLPNTDIQGAGQVAQKLLEIISKSFLIKEYELNVTASIGIALYPTDGTTMDELSKNADIAMYRAKTGGRNNYSFFAEER